MIRLNGYCERWFAGAGALGFDGHDGGHPPLIKLWKAPFRAAGLLDPTRFTIISKTVTNHARVGRQTNWGFRKYAWPVFPLKYRSMVNAVALTNPGIDEWIRYFYPIACRKGVRIALSLHVESVEEALSMGEKCNKLKSLCAVQINAGCVTGDTRVITQNGLQRIDQLKDESQLVFLDRGSSLGKVCGVANNGYKAVVKVKTRTGNEIRVSLDHRFKVSDSDGRLVWKRASDLTPGDQLLSRKGGLVEANPDSGGSVDFWYTLGHIYGDGWLYKNGHMAWDGHGDEADLMNKIQTAITEVGGYSSQSEREPDNRNGVNRTQKELVVLSGVRAIRDLLPTYQPKGEWRSSGFPDCVWSLGAKQLGAFLCGLFTTDGGISPTSGSRATFNTKFLAVAQHVKAALLALGVVSKIVLRQRETPFGYSECYEVTTLGISSLDSFRRRVGFALTSKSDKLSQCLDRPRVGRDKFLGYRNAGAVTKRIFTRTPTHNPKGKRSVDTTIRLLRLGKTDFLADSMIDRFLLKTEQHCESQDDAKNIRDYRENGWWFDEVVAIEPQDEPELVYDLVGSDTEAYITSGVVSHNCPNLPGHAPGGVASPEEETAEFERIIDAFQSRYHGALLVKFRLGQPWEMMAKALEGRCAGYELINAVPYPLARTFEKSDGGRAVSDGSSPLLKYGYEGSLSGGRIAMGSRDTLHTYNKLNLKTPVISGGGVVSHIFPLASEVQFRLDCGAKAIAFSTAFLWEPWGPNRVADATDLRIRAVQESLAKS